MAERVGFVPVDGATLNDLGLNSIGRNSKNTQNPGSRYKTGTVICGWETHPRVVSHITDSTGVFRRAQKKRLVATDDFSFLITR